MDTRKLKELFFDMEFTSLSPDAQIISLGVISDCGKSIYCEFNDFDLNRCDDWVKKNVVGKLKWELNYEHYPEIMVPQGDLEGSSDTERVQGWLKQWLTQFSDYQIQFITDCGTFDWYWMLQLIGEWKEIRINKFDEYHALFEQYFIKKEISFNDYKNKISKFDANFQDTYALLRTFQERDDNFMERASVFHRSGLPQLPTNISPVPQDLNDLIALKKGISVKDAFDLDREGMAGVRALLIDGSSLSKKEIDDLSEAFNKHASTLVIPHEAKITLITPNNKHSAIWDAKVIKHIYEQLK